ncbi:uncharacterized protein LOC102801896 [Saccoglossus kowalevskii]|uniref:UPF0651 protein P31B10.02, mitochondrial-like n=1 Tax=Saccoglossus kowalevskii TaxID=10224 RepID=A0ABM0M404_SACKO|nr:PREDICTED: UPF0651 protein P31B10.02, mitochondrial-like [Saccoglossus kowalevskii]
MSQGRLLFCCLNVRRLLTSQKPVEIPFVNHTTMQPNKQISEVIMKTESHDIKQEVQEVPAHSSEQSERSNCISTVKGTAEEIPGRGPPPELPQHCCMSGCYNCVWIDYAEKLTEYYQDEGKHALEAVDKIEDMTVRAFIKMHL